MDILKSLHKRVLSYLFLKHTHTRKWPHKSIHTHIWSMNALKNEHMVFAYFQKCMNACFKLESFCLCDIFKFEYFLSSLENVVFRVYTNETFKAVIQLKNNLNIWNCSNEKICQFFSDVFKLFCMLVYTDFLSDHHRKF